ncbi:MAG: phosphate ABC transporter substrate-binding protein PstS [Acidobacteriota bacterium]|nr:phosphate ABC transporter substrate-binding protein PstS [Acidobacteriota bacterium]
MAHTLRPSRLRLAAALLGAGSALSAAVLLNGTGATFPNPLYSKWFREYRNAHPNVQINYQSLGSGAGIRQVTEGTVDFGASDGPMTDEQIAQYRQKHGFGILHFPTVAGADVSTYNVPGIKTGLNFTPAALAAIYLGKITRWNDQELAKANPRAKLPDSQIQVVHRADGSGTTYCWTDYLSKISPEWKSKVGRGTSVNWPVGVGGKGNDGVAGQVKNMPNSIGYVELIYAIQNGMPYGNVQNAAGVFVKPDLASTTAAAADAMNRMPDDFRVSITDPQARDAYPIATFTWLLIPEHVADPVKSQAIKDFLSWALTTGQGLAPSLDYATIPRALIAKEQGAIAKIR